MLRSLVRFVLLIAALIVPALCWSGTARAQKPAKKGVAALIKQGTDYYDDQRYEESIQTLSAALLRPEITKSEKTEVYRLLAFDYILLGKTDEADGAVRGLLVTDENFELPASESPRFRDFFAESKKKWIAEGKPGMKPDSSEAKVEPVKI
jgi:hypothetical protein